MMAEGCIYLADSQLCAPFGSEYGRTGSCVTYIDYAALPRLI